MISSLLTKILCISVLGTPSVELPKGFGEVIEVYRKDDHFLLVATSSKAKSGEQVGMKVGSESEPLVFFWGKLEVSPGSQQFKPGQTLRAIFTSDMRLKTAGGGIDYRSTFVIGSRSPRTGRLQRGTLYLEPYQSGGGAGESGMGVFLFSRGSAESPPVYLDQPWIKKSLSITLAALRPDGVRFVNDAVRSGAIRLQLPKDEPQDLISMAESGGKLVVLSKGARSKDFLQEGVLWVRDGEKNAVKRVDFNPENSIVVPYPYGHDLLVKVGPKDYILMFFPAVDFARGTQTVTWYSRDQEGASLQNVYDEARAVDPGLIGVKIKPAELPAELPPNVNYHPAPPKAKRASRALAGVLTDVSLYPDVSLGALRQAGLPENILSASEAASPFDLLFAKPAVQSELFEWAFQDGQHLFAKIKVSSLLPLLQARRNGETLDGAKELLLVRIFGERALELFGRDIFWAPLGSSAPNGLFQMNSTGRTTTTVPSLNEFNELHTILAPDRDHTDKTFELQVNETGGSATWDGSPHALRPLTAAEIKQLETDLISKAKPVVLLSKEHRKPLRLFKESNGTQWLVERARFSSGIEDFRVFRIPTSGPAEEVGILGYRAWPDGGSFLIALEDGRELYWPTAPLPDGTEAEALPFIQTKDIIWKSPFMRASAEAKNVQKLQDVKLTSKNLADLKAKVEAATQKVVVFEEPRILPGPAAPDWLLTKLCAVAVAKLKSR